MRKLRWALALAAVIVEVVAACVWLWTRNRRLGTKFMNETVNRFLISRGLTGGAKAEIGTLEHYGRKSGIRRLTLIHPEPTQEGFRIMAPVGEQSEWARNVLAAGHCRIGWHERVYELDEPRLVAPSEVPDISPTLSRITGALGFRYVLLRRFADAPGTLKIEPEQFSEVVEVAGEEGFEPSIPEASQSELFPAGLARP